MILWFSYNMIIWYIINISCSPSSVLPVWVVFWSVCLRRSSSSYTNVSQHLLHNQSGRSSPPRNYIGYTVQCTLNCTDIPSSSVGLTILYDRNLPTCQYLFLIFQIISKVANAPTQNSVLKESFWDRRLATPSDRASQPNLSTLSLAL